MKFRLIADQRETFPVRVMCDVMDVSPAGYYAWRGRPESPRKAANRALLTGARCPALDEARRSMTSQVRNDHATSARGEQRPASEPDCPGAGDCRFEAARLAE